VQAVTLNCIYLFGMSQNPYLGLWLFLLLFPESALCLVAGLQWKRKGAGTDLQEEVKAFH